MSLQRYLFLLLPIVELSVASEVENASLEAGLAYGYAPEESTTMQGVLELIPEIDIAFGSQRRLVTSARIRVDGQDRLEPDEPGLKSYADASRPAALGTTGTAEIRDFYLELQRKHAVFRLGKQQIVWGRLDGIKVLDVLNPQEFREFILADFGESRIGLWSAYADLTLGRWRAEFAVMPDATGHAIPDAGSWFELTAPRFRFGAPNGAPTPAVDVVPSNHAISNAAAGMRLSRRVGRFDISAVAYTGIDHEPLGRLVDDSGDTRLQRYGERRELYGVGVERSFGGVVLRGEYAYQPARAFNVRSTEELTTTRLDQHRAAVGIDMAAPFDIFVNIQYLIDSVSNAITGLVRPARDEVTTLFLRRTFGYDKLSLELRWYHSVRDSDDILAFGADYALSSSWMLSLELERFNGVPDGLFGQFNNRDRATLTLGFRF